MKKKPVFLAISLLLILTGCGNKAEVPAVTTESIDAVQEDQKAETEERIPKTEENHQQNQEELEGYVKSIGESNVIVSKIFTNTNEEEGAESAVVLVGTPEEEVLITVNFSEDVKFEIRTVKNGGVNGDADVTITEGSFSDLKQESILHMTGYYVTPEQEFMAEHVFIYEFV